MSDNKRYPRTILAAACIPWKEDYSLAEGIFRDEIKLLVDNQITHFYLFGTAGEGYAVSDAQFHQIVEVFADETANQPPSTGAGLHPMVGVINLSTTAIVDRIKRVVEKGITDFQISLPSWGALNGTEVFTFFHAVCDVFPDCRFLHYNLPRAKRIVTPEEYAQLSEEIPNLVATKNCIDDILRIYELESLAPKLRHFMGETGFAYGSMIGEPGFLVSTVNSNFQRAWRYFDVAVNHDYERLLSMQKELMEMIRELSAATGSIPRIDGAYDKMFVKLHDPRFPLRMLPPYETNTEESLETYASALRERFPHWLPEG